MRRFSFVCCVVIVLGAVTAARADSIYLKNGNILEGKIVKSNEEKVWISLGGKAQIVVEQSEIEKIERDEKDGDDYFKRKGGVRGRDGYNPYGKKGGGAGEESGENPYVDNEEVDEETQARIDILIRDLTTRQDNRFVVRAKNKLTAIGFPAGKSLVQVMGDPQPKVRQRIAEILRDIGYKPATPNLIGSYLGDENGFTRQASIEGLEKFTGKRFGYNPYDPLPVRERAVERWKAWWVEEEAKYLESEEVEIPESMKKEEGEGEEGTSEDGGSGDSGETTEEPAKKEPPKRDGAGR